jgi:5-methyltetrahydrofolate--homocysteine methyltransferase
MKNSTILDALEDRVLVFDGGMGTQIQGFNLPLKDYNGLENCSEILNLTRPDVIREIHSRYFAAGSDIVETNTFGASPWVLAEFGLQDDTEKINTEAAYIAKMAAGRFSTEARPRYVAGSIGPGTRLPSLGHITWDEMFAGYKRQVHGLMTGGVDLIIVETCQDPLQKKCAVAAIMEVFKELGRRVPVIVQVTIETTGTMLLGTDISAAATILDPYDIDLIGINCATGPLEMASHVKWLSRNSRFRVSVQPNAGLPQLVNGKTCYPLSPRELAEWHVRFAAEDGVSIVGGCCGTTPDHIRAVSEAVLRMKPKARRVEFVPSVSSIYSPQAIKLDADVLAVGERTNANGSRQFKRLLDSQDWDGMVDMAKQQLKTGSHAIDVCTAFVGKDEKADMSELIFRLNTVAQGPIVVDSTEVPVIEEALKRIGGKAIVNSINLEDGEEKLDVICQLCRKYGAAVIALTIDEDGMAKTTDRKLEVARRIFDLAVNRHCMNPSDILFDPLTFTLATGQEEDRRLAIATLQGMKAIREEFPECGIILGLSNVSFGFNPAARQILNSVFMHMAKDHGLTAAIIHADKILPLHKITQDQLSACEELILDHRHPGHDPLQKFLEVFADAKVEAKVIRQDLTVEERLKERIIDGNRNGIESDLDSALEKFSPLQVINEILLDGMKVVGDLFGSGQMQLPFVLQSAETMKAAVAYLEPKMDKEAGPAKGTMVLATVRGDVHDIGKNLVDIILSNNGYRVVNLGIKQPVDQIIKAAKEHSADAIGMSGLLVKSTVIMKENLEEMRRQGIRTPVVLGGAALTRSYVEEDCTEAYGRRVEYAKDAFSGLRFMERLKVGEPDDTLPIVRKTRRPVPHDPRDSEEIREVPPFMAPNETKVIELKLEAVVPYLNTDVLFKHQWGFLRKNLSLEEHQEQLRDVATPKLREMLRQASKEGTIKPRAVYGNFTVRKDGDSLVFADGTRLDFPRQQREDGTGLCLVDYLSSLDTIGLMAVTIGPDLSGATRKLYEDNKYTEYLYLHGLGAEATEATAEYIHHSVRAQWGISGNDSHHIPDFFHKKYQGCRYSWGYPAVPDMADQRKVLQLLEADRIGISMDEDEQLYPELSTCAIVLHHPQAHWFKT